MSLPTAPLRPAAEVMRLARLGASHPTRLSFMRSLVRRLSGERARVSRPVWDIDAQGYGRAVYTVALGGRPLSLVAISTPIPDAARTDRVIAEAWDTAYVLHDGVPGADDLDRIAATAPRQEAARYTGRDLVLSRANRSARLFEHVVDALAAGRQPDAARIAGTGYLMRTTAVYGNGKFGIADRARIAGRAGLSGPFAAEMLTVWLIRGFTLDLVEHIAAARSPAAARLAPALRRHLGIGNATGLGMAPFLVSHPELLHSWIAARETALARVRALPAADGEARDRMLALIARAGAHVAGWRVDDARQSARIERLGRELAALAQAAPGAMAEARPYDALLGLTRTGSAELQELAASLAIEPHGALVDDLAETMGAERRPLEPAMTVAEAARLLSRDYGWALAIDFSDPAECHRFWYVSEEKLEPRLGVRAEEEGAEKELPLDIARQAQGLARALAGAEADEPVALFLLRHPEMREILRRVQVTARMPYAEIRDNLIGRGCLPVDMLRAKLAVFGASRFDPRSDRWTRVTLFQGAPGFEDIADPSADDWAMPALSAEDLPAR